MNTQAIRQPHAVLDLNSRHLKALKIERLLGLAEYRQPIRLLEIGCGSGGISHYFATHPTLHCQVTAVDVHDNRQVTEGYEFIQLQGVELPFVDGQFDVVISNHVIEHVGDAAMQLRHLAEIHRVLHPSGVGYLAVPNRWMLIEPHYRLAFLSWWPRSWRSRYLRLMRMGNFYDCEPLQLPQLEHMLKQAALQYQNISVKAWRETFNIERPQARATRLLRATPDALLTPLRRIIPTLIYRISHKTP